jgi:gas vesicle protein
LEKSKDKRLRSLTSYFYNTLTSIHERIPILQAVYIEGDMKMNKKSFFIGAVIGVGILSMANLVFASISGGSKEMKGIEVVVEEGDTLWNIADRYNEQADMSIRELLFYIQKTNELKGAIVHPGERIIVPME